MQTVGATEDNLAHLKSVLEPMRLTLQGQDFLGGSSPSYADCAAAGAFAVWSIEMMLLPCGMDGLSQALHRLYSVNVRQTIFLTARCKMSSKLCSLTLQSTLLC